MWKHHRLKSSVMFCRVSVGNAHAPALRCKHFPLSIFPCYSLFFLLSPSFMLFFITSFYHFLFMCFLMLFFVSFFYHLLLCYSLFFIILSLPLSVFPYVILCFFLLSPSLMLFFVFHLLLCYSLFLSFYHFLFLSFSLSYDI